MKIWNWYARKSFIVKMTGGFIAGIIAGVLLGSSATMFSPLGQLFLNLLKMIVIPLILLTLIVSVNHSNPIELGRIGLKIFPYYILSTAISVAIGIVLGKITNPGAGLYLPQDSQLTTPDRPSFIDVILNTVPSNIFKALSEGNVLPIVFFSVIVGLSFLYLRHSKDPEQREMGELLLKISNAGNEATMKILNGILQYAPIGVFGITAATFGNQGMNTVIALSKFILTSYLGVIILIIFVFPIFMKMFKVNVIDFYKNIKEAIFTAYVTCSSLGTLPITLRCARNAGIGERVANLTLPVGATVNMNGTAIRFGVAVIFAAEIAGVTLSTADLISIVITGTLAAIGTAGVPGAGLIGMSIVFSQAGLPIEIVALTAGINVLVDMIFTCGNVTGDLVGAKIVDQTEKSIKKNEAA